MKDGVGAGLLGAYYRPVERPFLNHSASIFEEEVAVHCNRDKVADKKLETYPDDFAGLTFGNQRAYLAPGPDFFKMAKEGKIKIVDGVEFAGLVKKMLVGEIDCVVNPGIVLNEALISLESKGLPERMRSKSKRIMSIPGGHFKFLHLWPGQIPPVGDDRTGEFYSLAEPFARREAASLRR